VRSHINDRTWIPIAAAPGIPPPNARCPAFWSVSFNGGREVGRAAGSAADAAAKVQDPRWSAWHAEAAAKVV